MTGKIFKRLCGSSKSSTELFFFHDFWDYHKSYLPLCDYLLAELGSDFAVTLIDYPGFGFSGGSRGDLKSLDKFCGIFKEMIGEKSSKKIILGGHGFGALVALKAHLQFDIDSVGLILGLPFFSFHQDFSKSFAESCFFMGETFGKLKVPFLPLGEIADEKWCSDPLNCRKISFRLFGMALLEGARACEWGKLINIPVLMIGGNSTIYNQQKMEYFSNAVNPGLVTEHRLFQNGYSEDIMEQIVTWIKKTVL